MTIVPFLSLSAAVNCDVIILELPLDMRTHPSCGIMVGNGACWDTFIAELKHPRWQPNLWFDASFSFEFCHCMNDLVDS